MKHLVRRFLDHLPYVRRLRAQVGKQGKHSAGHYHSPIPDSDDIQEYLRSLKSPGADLPDVDLNRDFQFGLLQEYRKFYAELPFPDTQEAGCRYYFDQAWFCYSDAIFLYSFLRHFQPKRIIEVGSGFSSAVMLDTLERFPSGSTTATFIDPNPERLMSILSERDRAEHRILDSRVQDVPRSVFASLGAGDLLFIDSSHVVKCGSDLQLLIFEVLPQLQSGVFVHFHDVFYPFEYPSDWLTKGVYWNEDYFLRAFLAYNSEWRICFFTTYVALMFQTFLEEHMPLCLKNPGGSIYIQKA